MSTAHYTVDGEIAVVRFDNPPVNSLGHALRSAIAAGVMRANEDAAVRAIVLIGNDRAFSAGADATEFNTPKAAAEPNLLSLIRTVEESAKPTVAAIGGACMGGGLELAMGCNFRVVAKGAKLALPEVKLGVLPGAGGTQRLPRLIGLEAALNMIVSGAHVEAEKLADTALIDALVDPSVDGDLATAAIAFARRVLAENLPARRVRDIPVDYPLHEPFLQFARNMVKASSGPFPAPLKCVDAVAQSITAPSFDDGLRAEREAFLALVNTPESKALRHAFFGERAAAKIDDIPEDTPKRAIAAVGIIGAGTMGGGISMNFLNAGIPVVLLEMKQDALDRGVATIRKNYESSVKKGKLSAEKLEQRMALLTPTLQYADFRDVDLVIEAVFEEIGVKETVFKTLDEVCKPGAILASNTSTLDMNVIAGFTKRPQDVVGLHFFSPANIMRLLEIIRAEQTGKDVMATVMALAGKIKKVAVVSGVCDGFIGNRMIKHYGREANLLVEEGASPQQVDRALEKFGMAMGPFRMADLAGNDIGWAIRKRLYAENPGMKRLGIPDRLCEMGRYGQKTGAGWYTYVPGRRDAIADPAVEEVIAAVRAEMGITPRPISDAEIVERCLYALVNEGARIVEEGIAARASDVDMVYLTGYGFPAHRGGPMFYAETVGLFNVVRAMKRFAQQSGDAFWQPAPLLVEALDAGRPLNG